MTGRLVLTRRGRFVRDGWLMLIVIVPSAILGYVIVAGILDGGVS